jgi:hypothetical protein
MVRNLLNDAYNKKLNEVDEIDFLSSLLMQLKVLLMLKKKLRNGKRHTIIIVSGVNPLLKILMS